MSSPMLNKSNNCAGVQVFQALQIPHQIRLGWNLALNPQRLLVQEVIEAEEVKLIRHHRIITHQNLHLLFTNLNIH